MEIDYRTAPAENQMVSVREALLSGSKRVLNGVLGILVGTYIYIK